MLIFHWVKFAYLYILMAFFCRIKGPTSLPVRHQQIQYLMGEISEATTSFILSAFVFNIAKNNRKLY